MVWKFLNVNIGLPAKTEQRNSFNNKQISFLSTYRLNPLENARKQLLQFPWIYWSSKFCVILPIEFALTVNTCWPPFTADARGFSAVSVVFLCWNLQKKMFSAEKVFPNFSNFKNSYFTLKKNLLYRHSRNSLGR